MAHFVRNVTLLAALSGPGLARTIETTKSVSPTKSTSRIVEANITWCSILSCVMALPLLQFFNPAADASPPSGAETVSLSRALRSADPSHACPLRQKWRCRTPPRTAALLAHLRLLEERRYRRCKRSSDRAP